MSRTLGIRMASPSDLGELAPLFDAYRRFYGQAADPERARDFIGERLNRHDSWILVAQRGDVLVGFTQLYPSFSSTRTSRIAVLNDLFVAESERGRGIGRALLSAAEDLGRKLGLDALELATATDNTTAQSLYEAQGWKRDTEFLTYGKSLR